MLRLTMIAAAVLLPFATMSAGVADDGGPKVDHAWARATPGAARTGAVYFRIELPTHDRLIGLATPVAGKAELHTHLEENGIMQMREVEGGLAVPAGRSRAEARWPFPRDADRTESEAQSGDSFPLTLIFEKAGSRDVAVKVQRLGAMVPRTMVTRTTMPRPRGDGSRRRPPTAGPNP